MEELSDSWGEPSTDSKQCLKMQYSGRPTCTHTAFGHDGSFQYADSRNVANALSNVGPCSKNTSHKNLNNDGFRNRRSFTINTRDDIKGAHQLSNKRKLSITMENTESHFLNNTDGFKHRKNSESKSLIANKYVPNDVYSCVFEQTVENNPNTVINMESPEEGNNNPWDMTENYPSQPRIQDIASPSNNGGNRTEMSLVENYYFAEMMMGDDVSYVNIAGTDDSASVTSSDSENDVMINQQNSYDPHYILGLLPCGHVFHFECIFEWLKKSKNCPTCRHVLTMYNIKVVNRETFQKYVCITKLKQTNIVVSNVPKSVFHQSYPNKKGFYKRSFSIL